MWAAVYLYLFVSALFLSLLLTPLARRAALRAGMVDVPGARKAHRRPTPLLGGLAIFAAVALVILLNAALAFLASRGGPLAARVPAGLSPYLAGALSAFPRLAAILLGGLIVLLLGIRDDAVDLPPGRKLLGQLFVAVSMAALGVRITLFIPSAFVGAVVTVAWIVVVVNSFNLLDNMDGLCAGVALIASALMGGISALNGNCFIASLFAVLAGALLGFLRYNFPRLDLHGGRGEHVHRLPDRRAERDADLVPARRGRPARRGDAARHPRRPPLRHPVGRRHPSLARGEHLPGRPPPLLAPPRQARDERAGAVLFVWLVSLCTGLSAFFLPRVGWRGGAVVFVQVAMVVSVIAILEYFGAGKNGNRHEGG